MSTSRLAEGIDTSVQVVVEIEEFEQELHRIMRPLYLDGFKRVRDVRALIVATGRAYVEPQSESLYTQVSASVYSDRDIADILLVLARLDEAIRDACLPRLNHRRRPDSVRRVLDKPYLIVELAEVARDEAEFERFVAQCRKEGEVIHPDVDRQLKRFASTKRGRLLYR